MKNISSLLSLMFLSACGVYNNSFDCPPGKGVGCAPVNEVLEMIVEKEEGEDVFVKDKGTALLLREQEKDKLIFTSTKSKKKYHLVKNETGNWILIKLPKNNNDDLQ